MCEVKILAIFLNIASPAWIHRNALLVFVVVQPSVCHLAAPFVGPMCPVTSAKRWCTNCHLLHRWKQTAPFSEALKNRVRTRAKSWRQTAPFSEALKNRVRTRAKSWRQSDPAGSVGAGLCWMKRLQTPTFKTLGIVNPATKRSPKTYF